MRSAVSRRGLPRADGRSPPFQLPGTPGELEVSEHLQRVQGGERIMITDRGRPIAKLTPLLDEATTLDDQASRAARKLPGWNHRPRGLNLRRFAGPAGAPRARRQAAVSRRQAIPRSYTERSLVRRARGPSGKLRDRTGTLRCGAGRVSSARGGPQDSGEADGSVAILVQFDLGMGEASLEVPKGDVVVLPGHLEPSRPFDDLVRLGEP